jgi:hypothetical protein
MIMLDASRVPTTALTAALLVALVLPAGAVEPICDGTSTVAVFAMDTDTGRSLLTTPNRTGGDWMIELDAAANATSVVADAGKHFGGSVGPGPMLALVACGSGCVQVERWSAKGWEPLGDNLQVAAASTSATTYDAAGGAWVITLTEAPEEGLRLAAAFRFEEKAWRPHGTWTVAAVGQPQALPAPMRKDGVVCGTGLFTASGTAGTWVEGLPSLPAARRGQVLPLSGTSVAYVSADGAVYLSADSGKHWRRSTWTPWEQSETVGLWRQGTDYTIDLPYGAPTGALQLVWFDRRNPADERVLLTRLRADGSWQLLGEGPTDIRSKSGERLPLSQVLVPQTGRFTLLAGCAAAAQGSGLVLRSYDAGSISVPRMVPLTVRP